MSKLKTVHVGIDVAARSLVVAWLGGDSWQEAIFDNTREGHKALLRHLRKCARHICVCLEATGIYHLELAIALSQHPACDIMVVNPRTAKDFSRAMNLRAKTDRVDARMLATIKGIGEASAIRILGEVSLLPENMTGKQWVAHAGLDPRPCESGTSIHRPTHISKSGNAHLRHALYMPALVAAQHDPAAKAFRDALVERGLKPIQATVAIMRKRLLTIRAILKSGQAYDPERFHQAPIHA